MTIFMATVGASVKVGAPALTSSHPNSHPNILLEKNKNNDGAKL